MQCLLPQYRIDQSVQERIGCNFVNDCSIIEQEYRLNQPGPREHLSFKFRLEYKTQLINRDYSKIQTRQREDLGYRSLSKLEIKLKILTILHMYFMYYGLCFNFEMVKGYQLAILIDECVSPAA